MPHVVFICGPQASGKTSLVPEYTNRGYVRLNRDSQGKNAKMSKLLPMMEEALSKGQDIVLDNTFATIDDRAPFIKIAKRYINPLDPVENSTSVRIDCLFMGTSKDDCLINACIRMIENHGKIPSDMKDNKKSNPEIFPPAVIFKYFKRLEKPSVEEGFHSVRTINFQRVWPKRFKNKAVIFDYDGTLRFMQGGNGKYPTCKEEIGFFNGRGKVIDRYKKEGYLLLGASNQAGIAKGDLTEDTAKELFEYTNKHLGHDIDYKFCPHKVPPVGCYCRKPGSGMGIEFIYKYNLDPTQTIMVGDMTSDKTFATRLGFKFIHADEFFKL